MKRTSLYIAIILLLVGYMIFQDMQFSAYKKRHIGENKSTWGLVNLTNAYLEADIALLRKLQPALDYTSLSAKDKNTIEWIISRSESYQKSIDTLCREALTIKQ